MNVLTSVRALALASGLVAPALNAFGQTAVTPARIDSGDTAWMLISSALVTLMVVPGIALFYSGLVRRKNALATSALVMGSTAFVTLAWVLAGYSLAFTRGDALVGSFDQVLLAQLNPLALTGHVLAPTIPEPVFVLFHLAFAMVTVALIFGSVVERIRFGPAMVFAFLWTILVYAPVAHWVWHPTGWLHTLGHMDYAGGTVVHLTSGFAGLALVLLTGQRRGYGSESMPPHNLLIALTGAGLLWIGWFGFNGGSALKASSEAGMAVVMTQVAGASGVVGWIVCEWVTRKQVTLLGIASGAIAGFICITPSSGLVGVGPSAIIGLVGSVACFGAVTAIKARFGYDDSLDVFGLHGVAGFVGTLLTGCFQTLNDPLIQVGVQAVGAVAVAAYVGIVTLAIGWAIRGAMGLRVDARSETEGLDRRLHGESLVA